MDNKKVLIIRLSALGDVMFTIPLANILKDNGYEVSWLVSEKGYQILKDNPCVDKIIFVPIERWKKDKNKIKNFKEYLEIIKQLRKEKFDIAIDNQMLWKSFRFTRFCGAKRRLIAKDAREFSQLGGNEIIPPIKEGYKLHVVKTYLKYAEYLGLNTDNIKITLPPLKEETSKKADELLSNTDKSKKTVIICPATTWQDKHWDKDNFKKVVENLKDKVNLIFTGMEKDKDLIEYISNGTGINLAGKTSQEELRAIFEKGDLVISLDSGSTHLAWATQKPKIISIYCATPASFYAPIGDKDKYIAIQSENCEPCHKRKCPLKGNNKNKCTLSPTAEKVLENVYKLLEI